MMDSGMGDTKSFDSGGYLSADASGVSGFSKDVFGDSGVGSFSTADLSGSDGQNVMDLARLKGLDVGELIENTPAQIIEATGVNPYTDDATLQSARESLATHIRANPEMYERMVQIPWTDMTLPINKYGIPAFIAKTIAKTPITAGLGAIFSPESLAGAIATQLGGGKLSDTLFGKSGINMTGGITEYGEFPSEAARIGLGTEEENASWLADHRNYGAVDMSREPGNSDPGDPASLLAGIKSNLAAQQSQLITTDTDVMSGNTLPPAPLSPVSQAQALADIRKSRLAGGMILNQTPRFAS